MLADITTTPLTYNPFTGTLSTGAGIISTGNLNFATSLAQYITSNSMSDIQPANRFGFRSSFTNQGTGITISPNGTSATSLITIHDNSDVANSGFLQASINASNATIASSAIGTGTAKNLILSAGGTTAQTINATTGVTSFGTIVPTCSTSASTTNQLMNCNNFTSPVSYTPVLRDDLGNALNSGNYVQRIGRYIQIGNLVWFQVRIQISAKTGLGVAANTVQITLPVNASSIANLTQAVAVGSCIGMTTSIVSCCANIPTGGQDYANFNIRTGASTGTSDISVGDISATFQIRFGGFYFSS